MSVPGPPRRTDRTVIDAYTPERGDPRYRVEHYDLDLDYRVTSNRLSGRATLSVRALDSVETLRVDLVGLRVGKVTVTGSPAKWTHRGDAVTVRLPRPLEAGARAEVTIAYAGTPGPTRTRWGTLGWEELAEGALVASQPTGAPTWFPCNDHPGDKATYRIAVECDSPFTVAATGVLTEARARGSRTRHVFEQAHPMATYLAAVHVGRYTEHLLADVPLRVRLLVPVGNGSTARHDLDRLPQMVAVLSERFGPYPFPEYTVVVTRDDLDIPLEAQGMATFGVNWLRGDRRHERLVAHELAHQWFGNSLTLGTWRDIWLHEGFACYAEWLWAEAADGVPASVNAREHHARLAALPQDLVLSDPGPRDLFDDRVYKRGALALHALRTHVGDATFFGLLRDWTATHADGTVSTEAFVGLAVEHAARGGALDAGSSSVRGLLAAWLDERPLPELSELSELPEQP
ncbi:M1 family metallopeptidase [Intrasporangium flavum]|uniref:M1 family metallopeptidase n=1 Tax=Intrasporangium flavum TaxID=1428657 RepID=UPI00096EE772|nr:M1 family metallopeptidase [Intrasporangium flavum]